MGDEVRNKEIVRKIEEAWNGNKLDALDPHFAPNFNNHTGVPGIPPGLPGAKMAHGAGMAAFPDRKEQVLDMAAEGDRVFVRTRITGTCKGPAPWFGVMSPNGRTIDFESWMCYRLANGKVVESWGINDGLLGMIQLGTVQPPKM